jgi:hypothetical protein
MKAWLLSYFWSVFWIIALGIALGTFFFYGVLDRESPRGEIYGYTHKLSYRPGEVVTGQWYILVRRRADGHTIRWLSSDADPLFFVNLPSEDVVGPIAEDTPIPAYIVVGIAPFTLPPMPEGKAYYHRRTIYYNNWLQRLFPALGVVVDYPVIDFQVLPLAGPG